MALNSTAVAKTHSFAVTGPSKENAIAFDIAAVIPRSFGQPGRLG